jgi:hypothetical protein
MGSEDTTMGAGKPGARRRAPASSPGGEAAAIERLGQLVLDWLSRMQEAERAYVEAELDRASFESFPASDPMSPATAAHRQTTLKVDCVIDDDRIAFTRALRTDDAASPAAGRPVLETLDVEGPDGTHIEITLRQGKGDEHAAREPLELPLEHASLVSSEEADDPGASAPGNGRPGPPRH